MQRLLGAFTLQRYPCSPANLDVHSPLLFQNVSAGHAEERGFSPRWPCFPGSVTSVI